MKAKFSVTMTQYNYLENRGNVAISDIRWSDKEQDYMWGVYLFLSPHVWVFEYVPEQECIRRFDLLNPERDPSIRLDFAVEFVGCRVSHGDPADPANHRRLVRYFGTKQTVPVPEHIMSPWVHLRHLLPRNVYPNSGVPL